MSTLAVATIESKADETPPTFEDLSGSREIIQGVWAWCTFSGTGTIAISDSFNVASLTDNGTGNYDVNFNTAMPNATYSGVGMSSEAETKISALNTTDINLITQNSSGTNTDAGTICVTISCNP